MQDGRVRSHPPLHPMQAPPRAKELPGCEERVPGWGGESLASIQKLPLKRARLPELHQVRACGG